MLYVFRKYTNFTKSATLISIKIMNTSINSQSDYTGYWKYAQSDSYRTHPSTFFRRTYFRTLITYINLIYATLCTPIDHNVFYYVQYMCIYYISTHPSFYFKKLLID